jgi:hypothetical protein
VGSIQHDASEFAHIHFIWLEVEMGVTHQGWWIRVILQAHMRRWSSGCTEEAGREDLGLVRICYQSFLLACHSTACSI